MSKKFVKLRSLSATISDVSPSENLRDVKPSIIQSLAICSEENDANVQLNNCVNFLTIWFFSLPQRAIYHVGLVFCRFIYIRLAYGLVKDGITLLHWLTLIFITVFILQVEDYT